MQAFEPEAQPVAQMTELVTHARDCELLETARWTGKLGACSCEPTSETVPVVIYELAD